MHINPHFATCADKWSFHTCLNDHTSFFLNLNHKLSEICKFYCIFSSKIDFKLIFVKKFKFLVHLHSKPKLIQNLEREVYFQISLDKKNHNIESILFMEPFYSLFDVEFMDKNHANTTARELLTEIKKKILGEITSIYNRILYMYYLQKKCIQSNKRERLIRNSIFS